MQHLALCEHRECAELKNLQRYFNSCCKSWPSSLRKTSRWTSQCHL